MTNPDFSDVESGSSSQPAGPPVRTGDLERDYFNLMRYASHEAASARLRGDLARYAEYRRLVDVYGTRFQLVGSAKDKLVVLQQFGRDLASVPAAVGSTIIGATQWLPLVAVAVVLIWGQPIWRFLTRGTRGTTWE